MKNECSVKHVYINRIKQNLRNKGMNTGKTMLLAYLLISICRNKITKYFKLIHAAFTSTNCRFKIYYINTIVAIKINWEK